MTYLAVYHSTEFVGTNQRVYPFGEKTIMYSELITVNSDGDSDFKAYKVAEQAKLDGFKLSHLYFIHHEVKIS